MPREVFVSIAWALMVTITLAVLIFVGSRNLAAMHAYWGGDTSTLMPAALASIGCFLLDTGLFDDLDALGS